MTDEISGDHGISRVIYSIFYTVLLHTKRCLWLNWCQRYSILLTTLDIKRKLRVISEKESDQAALQWDWKDIALTARRVDLFGSQPNMGTS